MPMQVYSSEFSESLSHPLDYNQKRFHLARPGEDTQTLLRKYVIHFNFISSVPPIPR
jgi:hypothetical protein